jgi:hypothetical protein
MEFTRPTFGPPSKPEDRVRGGFVTPGQPCDGWHAYARPETPYR